MNTYQSTYELEDTLTGLYSLANSLDDALAKFNRLACNPTAHHKLDAFRVTSSLATAAAEMRAGADTMLEEFKKIGRGA